MPDATTTHPHPENAASGRTGAGTKKNEATAARYLDRLRQLDRLVTKARTASDWLYTLVERHGGESERRALETVRANLGYAELLVPVEARGE